MPAIFMTLLFVAPEWVRNLTKERQPDIFWAEYVVYPLVQIIVVLLILLTVVAWLFYLERQTSTRLQAQLPSWRVTPWATLRPVASSLKLAGKEQGIPESSDKAAYWLAPLVAFVAACLALAIIPWGAAWGTIASVNIGFLYVLACASLSTLGLTLAGLSEIPEQSTVAALRSSAQVIACYLTMGLAAGGVLLFARTLSMTGIVEAQQADRIWYVVFQPLGFLLFVVAAMIVSHRATKAFANADESTTADSRWSLFLLSESLQRIALATTVVSIYLGGWWFPGLNNIRNAMLQTILSIVIFAVKMLLLLYGMWWLNRRFQGKRLLETGWQWLLPVAGVNLIITAILYLLALPKTRGGVFEMMREASGRLLPTGKGLAYFIITGVLLALLFIWLARTRFKSDEQAENTD
jgi:NADH-quinone oxidoreductase subunit H